MSTAGGIAYPVTTPPADLEDGLVCAGGVTYVRRTSTPPGGGAATVTYLDGSGATVATPGGPIVNGPCVVAAPGFDDEYILLCDLGVSPPVPFLRRERTATATGTVTVSDLTLAGAAYVLVGAAGVCGPSRSAVASDLQTITGAQSINPVTGHPNLQSVTLVVTAGTINVVAPAGTSGVPAGLTMTWSVSNELDLSLTAPTFTGLAGCTGFVLTTWRP